MISITNLQLTPVRAQNGLTFFASFVVNNAFQLANIAVYSKLDGTGFRCVFPVKELPNGSSIPLFYPINKEIGHQVDDLITEKANQLLLN